MRGDFQFHDRMDAGEQLGDELIDRGITPDLVLAIPRGGLPLGRAVANALDCPLDVVVAKKIGAPGNPEYAVGAVASDGSYWRNEQAIVDDEYFEREKRRKTEEARQKAETYRGGEATPSVAGKVVVVVDDGVATGSTIQACVRVLDAQDPTELIVAVPVGPADSIAALEALADTVICLATPPAFGSVGQHYTKFDQVSDEQAMRYL